VKTLVVVQARMGSSRLPGKVMMPLAGEPLLARMIERLRAATFPFEVCIATSVVPEDEPIRELATRLGIGVVSGHPTDLLDRHLRAADAFGADVVAKIPSDCPLIDPGVVDEVLGFFAAQRDRFDFVTNLNPPTWPDGNDVEVMPLELLRLSAREATRPHEREHTTPFIWDNPGRFRIGNVRWSSGHDLSKSHRFTIDYPEDYAFIARVYEELYRPERPVFTLAEILELLERKPEIRQLNQRYTGSSWHLGALNELRNVSLGPNGLEWQSATSAE
jgi:spore coat polysaccharide biosynthesis protein SpsF